ncbi:lysophospholipid acyltransferase family protein [Caldisericum exile]|uniref:Acyltransferase n=1 Tax=Caldisericum exile (strain DSM 21853 / NBRC 104410 / AZM16c01) TaxID=511051 RepID=A0A7U6GF69_CALEA|nr:lysophospholipid acyltransferase family protein [Caldisericum exile]BAL81280.1 putative acyltransferase [Caldisericum exile AZM16c01]
MLSFWYKLGKYYVKIMPLPCVYFTARLLGFFSSWFDKKRTYVLNNLRIITNKSGFALYSLGIGFYVNFALNIADYFVVVVKGFDKIKILTPEESVYNKLKELKGSNGLVIPTAHLGNWEVAGVLVGSLGFKAHGIGLPQQESDVEKFYEELRKRFNVIVHPFQGGFLGAYKGVKSGDIATIVSDRDINKDGICMEFFGRHVTFPKGASVLAYRTKAKSVFATLIREKGGYRVYFSKEFDIPFDISETEFSKQYVSKFASTLEEFVKKFPTQWFHFFDYFKEYSC